MKRLVVRIDYILKHNVSINKFYRTVGSLLVRAASAFVPIEKRSILFCGHGRKYNDSPRAIYEYLVTHSGDESYACYWALDNPDEVSIPGKCIKVKADTFRYLFTAMRCKYWITCVNIERGMRFKRKGNVYLNTWHGIPVKKIGNDVGLRKDYNFSHVDLLCVSSDYEIDIYKKALGVRDNSILRTGLPRNDCLYNISYEEIRRIKTNLGLPLDRRIILYAPTWRDSTDKGASYVLKPPININLWRKELGEDYVVLFRTHPYTNELLGLEFDEFLRDYSSFENVNDLLKISDILISDYSAIIFDYSILGRPIVCFAYDYLEYQQTRGLYLNIEEEMPGGVEITEYDVIDRIKNCNYEAERHSVEHFRSKYVKYGGQATQICIEALMRRGIG